MTDLDSLLLGNDNNRKFTDYFEFVEIVGKGAFATVVKAINLTTQEVVAVKIIKKFSLNSVELEQLRQEASTLSQLNHPNIVKFRDVKETDSRILIIMELINGGSLQTVMNKRLKQNQWFSEEECQQIVKHIFEALNYIHQQNIVHRDLKPDNILIDENDMTQIKISDFGLSTGFRQETVLLQKKCGTMTYMAPEVMEGRVYSKAVDIWSAGIIMYQLLHKLQHPYYSNGDTLEQMKENMNKIQQQPNTSMSQVQYSLYSRLIQYDILKRYTASQCLLHPWLNDYSIQDVPMTMDELFDSWQRSQKLHTIIKAMMMLKLFGFDKQLVHLELCQKVIEVNSTVVKEVRRREGRVDSLQQEFYDDLFAQYQDQLTDLQKLQISKQLSARRQSSTIDSSLSPHTPTKTCHQIPSKYQFTLKTKKVSTQSRIDNETTLEHINESVEVTPTQIQEYAENSAPQGGNDDMSPSPMRSKKKSPKRRTIKNLIINRTDSYHQQQQLEERSGASSLAQSPANPNVGRYGGSKFKIQLKPLEMPEQHRETHVNGTNESVIEYIKPPSHQMLNQIVRPPQPNNIRARQYQVIRKSNPSNERNLVQPYILDLSTMALGGSNTPAQNNQFLFPARRNSSLQQPAGARFHPNEFLPSKVLSQSTKKQETGLIYNFINGGPK